MNFILEPSSGRFFLRFSIAKKQYSTPIMLAYWEVPAVFFLLSVAVVLRLPSINSPLWYDEVITLVHFVRQPVVQLIGDYSSFNNHIFYSLQAKLAVFVFGEQPWALRLPAVIFGIASIWLLWRLSRPIVGPFQALLAAALMAVSFHHIWFSQNARGYTELMALSLAALVIFMENLGRVSWRSWTLFGVVLAASIYTHLTAGFFIASLAGVYALMLVARWTLPGTLPGALLAPSSRAAQWAPIFGFLFGGVLTLILYWPTFSQVFGHLFVHGGPDPMVEYSSPIWAFFEGVRTTGARGFLITIGVPIALALIVVGAVGLARKNPLVVLVAVLHVALTLGGLMALWMRIWPRFFFTDIAFALLFLTHGLFIVSGALAHVAGRLGFGFATAPRIAGIAAGAALIASVPLAWRNYTLPKQDFPAAITFLDREGATTESIGAIGLAAAVYRQYYGLDWKSLTRESDIDALRPNDRRRWIVMIFPTRSTRDYPGITRRLDNAFELAAVFDGTLGDGDVRVYREKVSGEAER
jgi:mannosyltransferase